MTDVALDSSTATYKENVQSRTQLGYDALNTVEIAVDTGILTFEANGGGGPPDNADVWLPGDVIEIDAGGGTGFFVITFQLY